MQTITINKKKTTSDKIKVEINKAIRETTNLLKRNINTLNDEYSNMLSTFEVFVQQTNDAIASMEAEIEELKKEEYSKEYFTFEALEPTDITLSYKSSQNKSIEYSFDKSTWTTFTPASGAETIASLNEGGKMYVRGAWIENDNRQSFGSTGRYKVSGNIMSLFYGDNFVDKTAFEADRVPCHGVFYNSTLLTDASNLVLPATTLPVQCYVGMFYGCTSLTTAPNILPATTLAAECYTQMFRGCTSLTTAPALPATTLATECYEQMFRGCTSLTTAPALPATTLATECYYGMFYGCTSLTTAPALPATTLANGCYVSMFEGCTSLTTAPELSATTLADYCCNWMFRGCTALTTAPALPATTLAGSCYYYMFSGCTALTTAPALPATTLANNCYYGMFSGCTALTTAPELPATTLADSCYRSMFYGCTSLNYIKCLATDIWATYCTGEWVNGVAATGTFVKDATMTRWTTGVNGIPTGWTVEDAA